ncbi:WxL domain-containing protein [Streptacidiphilus neutrinimicus]|uniref:WxL domain-containing protein n=1 Tax=Streptacidiphilus neutrinimicus TaxID=105420 RepID=UPI0005A76335|nr:WxL domain-containing protein [Streptacidiphilus neutrinimicus]
MFHNSSTLLRRIAAWGGAAALAVGAPVALAGSAHAASAKGTTVSYAMTCIPPSISGLGPQHGTATAEITLSDTTPTAGETVTVTYDVIQPASGNPSSFTVPAGSVSATGDVTLGGAVTTPVSVSATTAQVNNPAIPPGGAFPPFRMTGTFVAPASGTINFSPDGMTISVAGTDTVCTVDSTPGPVSNSATVTIPNNRTLTDTPNQGPVGTKVSVTGSGYTAGATVTIAGFAGTTGTGDLTQVTADAGGNISGTLTVNAATTTGIIAFEGSAYNPSTASPPAAFTVTATVKPGDLQQTLNSTVLAGTLSMTQSGTSVTMTPVPFGAGGASTGTLNTVTVQDFRGGSTGWSLTASNTNFSGPGTASLPSTALSWTPTCSTTSGSPSTCVPGSAGTVGAAGATLAGTPAANLTGGQFAAGASLTLTVPAFTAPGAYSSTLTLTLA